MFLRIGSLAVAVLFLAVVQGAEEQLPRSHLRGVKKDKNLRGLKNNNKKNSSNNGNGVSCTGNYCRGSGSLPGSYWVTPGQGRPENGAVIYNEAMLNALQGKPSAQDRADDPAQGADATVVITSANPSNTNGQPGVIVTTTTVQGKPSGQDRADDPAQGADATVVVTPANPSNANGGSNAVMVTSTNPQATGNGSNGAGVTSLAINGVTQYDSAPSQPAPSQYAYATNANVANKKNKKKGAMGKGMRRR